MTRAVWLHLLSALVLLSCGGSRFEGFKEVGDSVFLRYHRLGEGEALPTDSDSVLLRIRVALHGDEPGSLLSTERWYLIGDLRSGAFMPLLRRVHEGDSISMIAAQSDWPWAVMSAGKVRPAADTAWLQTELCLMRIKTVAQAEAEREALRLLDPEDFERLLIESRISAADGPWQRWGTSLMHYAIEGKASDTTRAHAGDLVVVAWKGESLINGNRFDEQHAFNWRYGDPDQVIAGIQAAVSLLRVGEEGRFILPSSLAFGEQGIPDLLDPWSPVEYEVRILSIHRHMQNP